ncbi:MAG: Wzz/FepE/Etk N-terminal domain-containing protein [Finegoldia sp.]|nr:Wzz/FepE/Etk N-terminal domain-containing protein [Finegoldia sp.]
MREITLRDALQAFKKNLAKIIGIMVVFSILTIVFGKVLSSETYKSTMSILIGDPQDFKGEGLFIQDTRLTLNQQVVNNVKQILESDQVAEDVAKEINNPEIDQAELKENVKILIADGTSIITMEYQNSDKELADEVLKTFYERADKLADQYMGDTTIQILDPASSNEPENSHLVKDIVIGAFLGLLVGVCYSFISFYNDPVVYDKDQLKDNTRLDSFASLPQDYTANNTEALRLLNAGIKDQDDTGLFSYGVDTKVIADKYNSIFDDKIRTVSPIKDKPSLTQEAAGIKKGILVYQNETDKMSEIKMVLQAMKSMGVEPIGALEISDLKAENKKYLPYA